MLCVGNIKRGTFQDGIILFDRNLGVCVA